MKNKGLISIIIPVYNCEQYIDKCTKSILSQSYRNFEIILVDDGSTDETGKICERYASGDKRIKVIHKTNSGPAAARNRGIEKAKGEFIFFIDADDYLEENAFGLLIGGYKKYKADIVIGNFKKIKNNEIEKRNDVYFEDNKLLNKQELTDYSRVYLKKPNKYLLFAFSWARLLKSSIIKDNNITFNEDLHTFEDVSFNFEYLNYTESVYYLKKEIYNHLVHDNYLSATMTVGSNPKKLLGYQTTLSSIANFLKNKIPEDKIKKEVGHAYITLTIIQLVRMCGQINEDNKKTISRLIKELVNDATLRENLQYYSPDKGESKIIPFLMKLKLVSGIVSVCKYKAKKRYKK